MLCEGRSFSCVDIDSGSFAAVERINGLTKAQGIRPRTLVHPARPKRSRLCRRRGGVCLKECTYTDPRSTTDYRRETTTLRRFGRYGW